METLKIILLTVAFCAKVTPEDNTAAADISKPTITVDPSHSVLYKSEKVTLHCQVPGEVFGLQYDWYRDSNELNHREPNIEVKENGKYECKAKSGASESEKSDSYALTLQDPPKAKLTASPEWPVFYTDEDIKLQCRVENDFSGWTFQWRINGNEKEVKQKDLQLILQKAHSGTYSCKGTLENRSVTTNESDALQLTVKDPPKAKLTVSPKWTEFYPGEKISFHCRAEDDSSGWTFKLIKNGQELGKNGVNEFDVKYTDSGEYACTGKLNNRAVMTQKSDAFQLNVKEHWPKPVLRRSLNFPVTYTGDQVTFSCEVNVKPSNWVFHWFKDSNPITADKSQHSISRAGVSDSGNYSCQVGRSGLTSDQSDSHILTIQVPPKAKLTVSPKWPEFYPGEKISFQCGVQDHSIGWTFKLIKNSQELGKNGVHKFDLKYTDSGEYACTGKINNRNVTTQKSAAFQLNVKEHWPKPILSRSLNFPVIYAGEKVTFSCEVNVKPSNWVFHWFKDSNPITADKSQNSISSAEVSNSGNYSCQVGRSGLTSDQSDSHILTIQVPPKAKLTVSPEWTEFYPGEKISFQCEVEDGSSGWTFKLMKNGQELEKDGIDVFDVKYTDSGEYTCTGKLNNRNVMTQKSDAFQLNVKEHWPKPILSRSLNFSVIYAEEEVTFSCGVNVKPSNWVFHWLKDSIRINADGSKHSISSAKLSDSGNYRCQVGRNGLTSDQSDSHILTVKDRPKAKLTVRPEWPEFYPGEKISLRCGVEDESSVWTFRLMKKGLEFGKNGVHKFDVKYTDSGEYACTGKLNNRKAMTQKSEAFQLNVKEHWPKPILRRSLNFPVTYTGDQVTFSCEVNVKPSNWVFHWFKDSNLITADKSQHSISRAEVSDSGNYRCQVGRSGLTSDQSDSHILTIQALPPAVLTLETELNDIVAGEMTLKCNISDGRQWNYTWFENERTLNGSSQKLKVPANEQTIKSEFKCQGVRTERPLKSAKSEGFTANNILFKRKILLAITGVFVCCIIILIIGCVMLKLTRKPEKKEAPQENLFIQMDAKAISPLKEYMDGGPTDMEECEEKDELLTDRVSASHEDGVVKDEDTPATDANGMTSFKGV